MINELNKLRELTETLTSNGYLKDQTNAWKYAFDSVKAFVCIVNPACKIKFINKALANLLDTKASNLINRNVAEIGGGEFALDCTKTHGGYEFGVSYSETFNKWLNKTKFAIKDGHQNNIGYLFIFEDVTERHVASQRLKESYHRLSFIVEAIDGYTWNKEPGPGNEFVHTFVDPGFCKDFYGITTKNHSRCQETLGKTTTELLDIFRKDGRMHTFGDICVSTDQHCATQGVPCEYFEMGYIEQEKGKPEWFILRVRKTPVFDKDGELVGMLGFANNYTKDAVTIKHLIKRGLVTGNVRLLDNSADKAKVYWVIGRSEQKVLSHVDFP